VRRSASAAVFTGLQTKRQRVPVIFDYKFAAGRTIGAASASLDARRQKRKCPAEAGHGCDSNTAMRYGAGDQPTFT
jgi:hypothetical protein